MIHHSDNAVSESGTKQFAPDGRLFRATIGCFDDANDRETMDELAHWVEETYRKELHARPSKHVYVRTMPADIAAKVDRLRDSQVIRSAILLQFDGNVVITPMKNTDELYISHYNKDYGGDHGLFTKHYDGNLRFMPVGAVVRALIYLQSDATYKVVFADSRVEKSFGSYEFGLLDFHRELHWVEGEYRSGDRQRILLKCNYLVAPKNTVWITKGLLFANTGVFYLVKAAMEYSKSPKNPFQLLVGYVCNLMRVLNNIHPLAPIVLIMSFLVAVVWGVSRLW